MNNIELMLEASRNALACLNVAMDAEGDTFGIHHNTAVDTIDALEKATAAGEAELKREPDFELVADFLNNIGWRSPNDAQWLRLKAALPELRAILNRGEIK